MPLVNRYSEFRRATITSTGNAMVLCGNTAQIGDNSGDLTTPAGGTTKDWTLSGSSAEINILPGSNILYAELIWYSAVRSNLGPDLIAIQDTPIEFTTPDLVTHIIAPENAQSFTSGPVFTTRFRSNSVDIIPLIQANGPGNYIVARVPISVCPACNNDNTRAGWQLIVVYENAAFPFRSLTVNTGIQFFNNLNPLNISISGFSTPSTPPVNGRMLLCAADGDPRVTGESFSAGPTLGTLVPLGNPVLTPNPNPGTVPNNPQNNVFAGQINISDPLNPNAGLIDTTGTFGTQNHDAFVPTQVLNARNKWDITNLDLAPALTTNQTNLEVSASVADPAGFIEIQSISIQVDTQSATIDVTKVVDRTAAEIGDRLLYTISIANSGELPATNVILTDIVPTNTAFVTGSVIINGTSDPLADPNLGINLNTINSGATTTVLYNADIVSGNLGDVISNTATVDFQFTPVPGNTITANALSNQADTLISGIELDMVKSADKSVIQLGDTVTYTTVITNNGTVPINNVIFTDPPPPGTVFIQGSVDIDGVNDPNANPEVGINLGSINATDSVEVSFMVRLIQIVDLEITNVSNITYEYQVPGGPIENGTAQSNAVTILINRLELTISSEQSVHECKIFKRVIS